MKKNTGKCKERGNSDDAENIIDELKRAYRAINALQKTPSHRKIVLDVERRLRSQKEKPEDASV